jgi:aspartyl/asparaginyl beta-hydroxylase (cupin superfamily)
MIESAREGNWMLFQEYYLNWPAAEVDKKRQQIFS